MTTRYSAKSTSRFGVPGLPSGYQTKSSGDFTIPSVGIEDVDGALFKLFNEEIPLLVAGHGTDLKRCPVIFFAGEKWALNKHLKALKDRNGTLILPICTAVRTSIVQDTAADIAGRGINQQTGEIVIHRRLDKSDRGYQGLINRLLLKNQTNLAVGPTLATPGQLTTLRAQGDLADDPIVQQGGLLLPDRKNNIYETIVVPSPQFFTAQYEVTLWAQYTEHMNQMVEQLISSQLPQGNVWQLTTPKGYWFLANVDGNAYNADTNTDDFSQTERLIKYKFVIKVPGYILASSVPGAPVPIKRYVSSPSISFDVDVGTDCTMDDNVEIDPFLGSDDPTLPLDSENSGLRSRRDGRQTNATRLYPGIEVKNPDDPAIKKLVGQRGRCSPRYKKVINYDSAGNPTTRLIRVNCSPQGESIVTSSLEMIELVVDPLSVHWGTAVPGTYDSAFVLALSGSATASTLTRTFTVSAGVGQYIYYAFPAAFGAPTFIVGGWTGGFVQVASGVIINDISYVIWRSDNSGLGSTIVNVLS